MIKRERLIEIIEAEELFSRIDIIGKGKTRIFGFQSDELQDLCKLALRGLASEGLADDAQEVCMASDAEEMAIAVSKLWKSLAQYREQTGEEKA